MNSKEIRNYKLYYKDYGGYEESKFLMLREIAAQLAELNEYFKGKQNETDQPK